jgi:hypothetical protein
MRDDGAIFAIAACVAVTIVSPAAGQIPDTSTAANPPPTETVTPPLHLSASQRLQIREAVAEERSEPSFDLTETKSAESFEPGVGSKLPKGLVAHALPRPLIYQLPILQHYTYVKFKGEVLIVNP